MKRFIVLFLGSLFALGAFAGNPAKRLLLKGDSLLQQWCERVDYDTNYVCRSEGKIGLKLWGNMSGSTLKAHGDGMNARLSTDAKNTLSVDFGYYDLSLDLSITPSSLTRQLPTVHGHQRYDQQPH